MLAKIGMITLFIGGMMGENENVLPALVTMLVGTVLLFVGIRRADHERK